MSFTTPPAAGRRRPARSPFGLTPSQVRTAYGVNAIRFGSVAGDGSGQTIAIIDAYDDPTISQDLAAFDAAFGLPAPPSFRRVAQDGTTNYPSVDPATGSGGTWEAETALDVEWAHAMAPAASLLLVKRARPATATCGPPSITRGGRPACRRSR